MVKSTFHTSRAPRHHRAAHEFVHCGHSGQPGALASVQDEQSSAAVDVEIKHTKLYSERLAAKGSIHVNVLQGDSLCLHVLRREHCRKPFGPISERLCSTCDKDYAQKNQIGDTVLEVHRRHSRHDKVNRHMPKELGILRPAGEPYIIVQKCADEGKGLSSVRISAECRANQKRVRRRLSHSGEAAVLPVYEARLQARESLRDRPRGGSGV